ncbi:MAG: phosphonate C-P lyase system protein PhnG [Chloroflexota bacterium]
MSAATTTPIERESRLQAFGIAPTDALIALADEVLETLDVEVTRGPRIGLLMVTVEEPSERLPFHFTEVAVAEAEVSAGGVRGYGIVLGREPGKALAAAILDAALEHGHAISDRITRLIEEALATEEARLKELWDQTQQTRVIFDEMAP